MPSHWLKPICELPQTGPVFVVTDVPALQPADRGAVAPCAAAPPDARLQASTAAAAITAIATVVAPALRREGLSCNKVARFTLLPSLMGMGKAGPGDRK
jgi:hypothetical protein